MRQISGAEALMQFALVLTGTFCILSVVLFLNWMVHHLLHKGNLKTRVTFSLRFSPSQATFSFISIKKKKVPPVNIYTAVTPKPTTFLRAAVFPVFTAYPAVPLHETPVAPFLLGGHLMKPGVS